MDELKIKTVLGVKWLVSSSFLQKVISTVTTVVLARILDPSTFGLCALGFIITDAFGMFRSMGFDSALIQRKDNIDKAANTVFFVIPTLGIVLYLILFFYAPLIGKFLNNFEIVSVVRVLGLIFIIGCFGKVPAVLLEKNIEFKKISILEFSGRVVFSVVVILLAFLGFNVWSLVIAFVIKTFFENVLTWILAKWVPRFIFDIKIFWEMFNFGKFLALVGIVLFLKMTLDNLLVGKILGVKALGIYAIAFNIANFSADYFAAKVYRVIFPAFSKIQSDIFDLKTAFLKTTKIVSIFSLPFCIILIFFADLIIKIMYGPKWLEAIPVLRILAFAGLFNSLPVAMGPLFNATGNSKFVFWFSAIQVGLFFIFITPIAKLYGLVGVGIVVSLSQLIAIIAFLPFTMKLISLKTKELLISLKPCILSSILMTLMIIFLKIPFLIFNTKIPFIYCFIIIIISTGVYGFNVLGAEKILFKEIRNQILPKG